MPAWEAGARARRRARPLRAARAATAAGRPRRRGGAALRSLVDRVDPRGAPPPGDGHRPGRRRQVAPAARADAHHAPSSPEKPRVREGRCPAYGSGLAYWALGEIVRGQFEIVDTDDSETAWGKLVGGVEELISDEDDRRARRTAWRRRSRARSASRPPSEARRRGEDPQQMRDRFFSAVRAVIEAASRAAAARPRDRGHPLGRRGNARPDRVPRALGARPAADRLPGPRRAARPPARLGRRPAERDHDRARAARRRARSASSSRRCCRRRRAQRQRRAGRARSPSAPAATRCSPRRWSTASPRRGAPTPRRCRRRSTRCSPRASTR